MTSSNSRADLPLPVVSSLLPDDPRWDETGLLPADKALSPLPFEVPPWSYQPVPGLVTVLDLYWGSTVFDSKQWDSSVPSLPPADLRITVPVNLLTPGVHELWYRVRNPLGNELLSERQTITIDLTPPALGANSGQLLFDTSEITEKYLQDHNDRVEGRIQSYVGGKPGDVVTWYWNDDPFDVDDADVVATRTLERGDIGSPVTLVFEGEMIRTRGDGDRYAFYSIKDRAGNTTPESRPVELLVNTTPVPRVLPPVKVKEAPGSTGSATLNPGNAINGVTVVIPDTAVIHDGEGVEVQWGTPGGVGSYRAKTPITPGGREFKVPGTCIAAHFAKSLPVYYEVTEPGVPKPHVSQNFTLSVSDYNGGWPTVQSDSVDGSVLSLSRVTDAARFTLEDWPFMSTDQFITVRVVGLDTRGEDRTVPVLTEQPVPEVADKIDVGLISKANLQGFMLDYSLEVYVDVSFDNKQTWKRFPRLQALLVA